MTTIPNPLAPDPERDPVSEALTALRWALTATEVANTPEALPRLAIAVRAYFQALDDPAQENVNEPPVVSVTFDDEDIIDLAEDYGLADSDALKIVYDNADAIVDDATSYVQGYVASLFRVGR